MHLQELFRRIEENRREFMEKWTARACHTGSATGAFSPGENGKPNDEVEEVLTQVEVTAGK